MADARAHYRAGELDASFRSLERAHILGQRQVWPHTLAHWWMFKVGWRRRDPGEVFGQVSRILASLIFSRIWVPVGNTGGADVSPLRPMPVPSDLAATLEAAGLSSVPDRWSILLGLLKFVLMVTGIAALAAMGFLARHHILRTAVERQWDSEREQTTQQIALRSVRSLSVLPLVNWHSADARLKTEVGVSYLVKTDKHTILFDLGQNSGNSQPSPLEHNMRELGVSLTDIDALFISHLHFDHVGGRAWSAKRTFALGRSQYVLPFSNVFTPSEMTYPGLNPRHTPKPIELLPGIATTGTIARQLLIGRIHEQALVINLAGHGLVAIVGCGHQTQQKLIERIERSFRGRIYGIIGDLHYPVPSGRIPFLGMNGQRVFASGKGPFSQLTREDIQADIARLQKRKLGLVALGGHDSSDETIGRFARAFPDKYRHVRLGEWIHVR